MKFFLNLLFNPSPDNQDIFNTLLYFYSTSTQVLGAILAITGAFVVFKIDSLKKDLFGASQWIIDFRNNQDHVHIRTIIRKSMGPLFYKLKYAQIANSFDEMEEIITQVRDNVTTLIDQKETHDPEQHEVLYNCNAIINRKKKIDDFIRNTKITYLVNGSIVTILLAGFFIIPILSFSICLSYWFLFTGWAMTAISLGWIIWYLISSIGINRKDKEESVE